MNVKWVNQCGHGLLDEKLSELIIPKMPTFWSGFVGQTVSLSCFSQRCVLWQRCVLCNDASGVACGIRTLRVQIWSSMGASCWGTNVADWSQEKSGRGASRYGSHAEHGNQVQVLSQRCSASLRNSDALRPDLVLDGSVVLGFQRGGLEPGEVWTRSVRVRFPRGAWEPGAGTLATSSALLRNSDAPRPDLVLDGSVVLGFQRGALEPGEVWTRNVRVRFPRGAWEPGAGTLATMLRVVAELGRSASLRHQSIQTSSKPGIPA